jgi:hypothetical protein
MSEDTNWRNCNEASYRRAADDASVTSAAYPVTRVH